MVNATVEKATSDMLIGPDWAMNIEICDVCNNDPAQAKDVVKGIKKRLGSRNPKVQLLALTLLETIVKNCGDIVHMHVAEKDMPHEMVKIFKKKPDFHVKEKILILIDTWQEAFGGPRAKYPQYYAAYQELLRNGAAFPQRSDRSAPVFTPPQTQPLASYPQNLRNTDSRPDASESSAVAEFPTLSLTEIQNALGIIDVLAEMLNALDPGNKEGLKQEVIVDLVEQCRNYKQRVVHLVSSTSDESLLSEGLALNDDLQKVLAKHESIVSGTALKTPQALPVPVQTVAHDNAPLIDTGDSNKSAQGSSSSTLGSQLALPAPPTTNGPPSAPTKASPKIDLLSGDYYNSPTAENPLALVPVNVGEPQPVNDVSQQNALALVDMYAPSNSAQSTHSVGQSYPLPPQFQQQTNFQKPHSQLQPNGSSAMIPQYEQSFYTQGPNTNWNSPMAQQQQQQPSSTIYGGGGGQTSGSLPPPPWEEVQPTETAPYSGGYPPQQVNAHSQPLSNGTYSQASVGMYGQPVYGGPQTTMNPQVLQNNQFVGFQPQPMQMGPSMGMYPQSVYMYPQQMYANQVGGYGYGYGQQQQQQQSSQFMEQRMSGLSVRDNGVLGGNSSYVGGSTPSYVHAPAGKPSKQDDKFFGDLVDMSKFKPTKAAGSSGTV